MFYTYGLTLDNIYIPKRDFVITYNREKIIKIHICMKHVFFHPFIVLLIGTF